MTDKLSFLDDQLDELRRDGLFTTIRTLESAQGAWLTIGGRRVLNLCSNNYLGLANDDRLVGAAKAALDRYGIGPGAVRTIAGTMALHDELEAKLAAALPELTPEAEPGPDEEPEEAPKRTRRKKSDD